MALGSPLPSRFLPSHELELLVVETGHRLDLGSRAQDGPDLVEYGGLAFLKGTANLGMDL